MSESIEERLQKARKEAEIMKEKIKAHRLGMADTTCTETIEIKTLGRSRYSSYISFYSETIHQRSSCLTKE